MYFIRWWKRPVWSFLLPVIGAFIVLTTCMYLLMHPAAVLAQLNDWKILPQKEGVTELYLDNYADLPKQIVKGQTVPLTFTIHNLEGNEMTYPYVVYLYTEDGARIPIASSTVTLADNQSGVYSGSYTFTSSVPSAVTVFIELPSVGEELHFVLPSNIQP